MFLSYNYLGHMSKSTPDLALLGTCPGGDDSANVDLKPRRLHRNPRIRSPETKYLQHEDEDDGSAILHGGDGDGGRTAVPALGEGCLDTIVEGLTAELVTRILTDVDDVYGLLHEAELLGFIRSELLGMVAEVEDHPADWATLVAPAAWGLRSPDAAREARQVKFATPLQAAASRRARAPTHRTPTPGPDSVKASLFRQQLYAAVPAEPEETELPGTPQAAPQRRSCLRGGVRSARGGTETSERPLGASLGTFDDPGPATARAPQSLLESRLIPGPGICYPTAVAQKATAVPRNTHDAADAKRPLSPQSVLAGSAGRGPRPTTPHKARPSPEARMTFATLRPEGVFPGAGRREAEDASQSPRQEKRSVASQTSTQRRSTASLQPCMMAPPLLQGAATPRSSARAAAVAAGVDPRAIGLAPTKRVAQLSPSRMAAAYGSPAPQLAARLAHKSMSPSRSGLATRRIGSPRQGSELHARDLSPGPAVRIGAESGYLVTEERDIGVPAPTMPRILPRSRAPPEPEAHLETPQQRGVAAASRACPKDVATQAHRVQMPKKKAPAVGPPVPATNSTTRGYSLYSISQGDEVGGVVTHTSWVGPFVNIGVEVDGFVDPNTLPDKLTLSPGDLVCGLVVDHVDGDHPKLMLNGKNAWRSRDSTAAFSHRIGSLPAEGETY